MLTTTEGVLTDECDIQDGYPQQIREVVNSLIQSRMSVSEMTARLLQNQLDGNKGYNSTNKTRRIRIPWDATEIKKLIIGVLWCGVGNWSHIHSTMGFSERRSYTDLKDKWRNLLDPRSNARTPMGFKSTAAYVQEITGGRGRSKSNSRLRQGCSWEECYNEIEAKCGYVEQQDNSNNDPEMKTTNETNLEFRADNNQWVMDAFDFDTDRISMY